MPFDQFDIRELESRASDVAAALRAVGNDKRLMILCRLVEHGEVSVGALSGMVDLSQSALSQHLARLREEGVVGFRRDGQTLHYRIEDHRIEDLIGTLHKLYCGAGG